MNNYFLLVVLPNLCCFFSILGVMGFIASIISFFVYLCKNDEAYSELEHEAASKYAKISIKLLALSMSMLFITCFIPNKKEMIELKVISVVSELKGLDKIPQKLINRLNDIIGDESDS